MIMIDIVAMIDQCATENAQIIKGIMKVKKEDLIQKVCEYIFMIKRRKY